MERRTFPSPQRHALKTGAVLACLVTLLHLAPVADVHAAPTWVRVETPNFVVFGEIGERRTAEIAMEFERFREALIRLLPRASNTRAPVPTLVFVFGSKKSYQPFQPTRNGKTIEVSGYFTADDQKNVITLLAQGSDAGLHTVFHEYAHLVVTNVTRRVPAWLNEGLAEFYSTFQIAGGGRGATIGTPIGHHLQLLNESALMRLEDLLAVDSASAVDESHRRTLFYAQSWALVHMLLTQDAGRAQDLTRYLGLVTSGTNNVDAWRQGVW